MSEATETDAVRLRRKLERLTVNLTPRSQAALGRIVDRGSETQTDALNRAIQIYDYLDEIWDAGGEICIEREPGVKQVLKIF